MSDHMNLIGEDIDVEKGIIQAFGYSIIEFEQVLFHKYLISSGPASLITEEMFHKHLLRMYSKGFIAPLNFQGKRVWKKLVISLEPDEEYLETPEDETLRDIVQTITTPTQDTSGEGLVSVSRSVANDIMTSMKETIAPEWNEDLQKSLLRHAEEMRRALSDSKDDLIRYLESNIPDMKDQIEHLLQSKGEEIVLLSLRLISTR